MMSLDGRLVGTDDYEFEDYYAALLNSIQTAFIDKGNSGQITIGPANHDFKGEIGKSGSVLQLKSYAAYLSVHGEPPSEPDFSVIGHELNEINQGRLPLGKFKHLINHSDSNGFYIPVDFDDPFSFDVASSTGDGSWKCDIGSSNALLRELDELNQFLKVPGDVGQLNGTAVLDQQIAGDTFEEEKRVWGMLHWLARESVARSLLLEFC
ncbi:hypothetical protein KF913_21445 [Candidatus Obscuribacterales bacterium]|jgi:hypothetical protein|nr:hypothetical protein [Candidatus Obscuribacterales bacterium]